MTKKRKRYNTKTCMWNGIFYESISEAAHALNIDITTMRQRLKNGYICDADMIVANGGKKRLMWEIALLAVRIHNMEKNRTGSAQMVVESKRIMARYIEAYNKRQKK